jgi:hypothetical protein
MRSGARSAAEVGDAVHSTLREIGYLNLTDAHIVEEYVRKW